MRILINALSGIGDALMFTPALTKLKEELPEAKIDALVMFKGVKDIYERFGEIDKVIYHDFLNASKISSLKLVLSLRKKYDISINVYPSNRKEYNLINFLIGSKKRAAVKYLRKDFENFGFLNNLTIRENDSLHNAEENINLISKILNKNINDFPPYKINLNDDEINFAKKFLSNSGIAENDIVIGFHPGCSPLKNHTKRRWEPEKFAALGKMLIKKYNAFILIFGGNEEDELKQRIINLIESKKSINVQTNTLLQTAALMKRSNVFVSNDSSLMHIAAALKLKTVAIIGPTNTNYIHPWQTEYKIVSLNLECSPCFYYSPKPLTCHRDDIKFKCIKELSVELVLSTVESFIEG
ncbi:glycosyltransferase family 9 protein [Melioribacteraceae bacterium 4301-Me]|uniref:glycosyltransferase family 9 protein n=1 Tax=Pyranulibacter aquaticus TaxID=3163344 RepID=UPI003597762F